MSDIDKKGELCIKLKYELLEDFDSTMIELTHPDFDGSIYATYQSIQRAQEKLDEVEHVSFFSGRFLEPDPDEDEGQEAKEPKRILSFAQEAMEEEPVSKISLIKNLLPSNAEEKAIGKQIVSSNQGNLEGFLGGIASIFSTFFEVKSLLEDAKKNKK